MDSYTQDISDEQIKNMMDQYFKIVTILKEDCKNKGIVFFWYGYFRKWDSINESKSYSLECSTAIYPYDKRWLEKDLRNTIGL